MRSAFPACELRYGLVKYNVSGKAGAYWAAA